MKRFVRAAAVVAVLVAAGCTAEAAVPAPPPGPAPVITVYKSPLCGCCTKWEDHAREHGFDLRVETTTEMGAKKQELGIPSLMGSCHTSVVGDYVVEGHVPADLIHRLLAERPDARGLVVPGMPAGSPGMEGGRKERYHVLLLAHDGSTSIYATR